MRFVPGGPRSIASCYEGREGKDESRHHMPHLAEHWEVFALRYHL
jgi:hypothetical protein